MSVVKPNQRTVESRFLEPPGETQIGSRNREFEKSMVASNWHQITLNWPGIVWL